MTIKSSTIQPMRFTFDTVFDTEGHGVDTHDPAPRKKTRWTEEELKEACQTSYAEGFEAGLADATARAAADLARATEQLANAASSIFEGLDTEKTRLTLESSQMALAIAKKLAPALIAARPTAEIEAVVAECLQHLNREPHLVIRTAEGLVDHLKDHIDAIALRRGLAGKVILLGQPDMVEGDCLIEWADGGVSRDYKVLEREIEETVRRYVQSLGGTMEFAGK